MLLTNWIESKDLKLAIWIRPKGVLALLGQDIKKGIRVRNQVGSNPSLPGKAALASDLVATLEPERVWETTLAAKLCTNSWASLQLQLQLLVPLTQ